MSLSGEERLLTQAKPMYSHESAKYNTDNFFGYGFSFKLEKRSYKTCQIVLNDAKCSDLGTLKC